MPMMMHTAAQPWLRLLALWILCGTSPLLAAWAEDAATATASTTASAATARERLYTELAADVVELEQRGSILKRVVKLVTPAVVHIEARRETEGVRPARGETE